MQQYKSKRDQLLLLRAQQLHHMDGGNENFGAGFGVEADDEVSTVSLHFGIRILLFILPFINASNPEFSSLPLSLLVYSH